MKAMAAADPIDIVILTNGPGEVATWVKPVVQALSGKHFNRHLDRYSDEHSDEHSDEYPDQQPDQQPDQHPDQQPKQPVRISVMLSPCPHASGQEHITLAQYPEVDRVQSADHFFKFLLTGKTANNWDWHPRGVVVFLGGDQLYTVLVAKRIGRNYRTVTYAEWDARWPRLIDRFGVMRSALIEEAPAKHREKFSVVGDLMADVQQAAERAKITTALGCDPDSEILGFLPGSKPIKLKTGVPMVLAIAQNLHRQNPDRTYVIGVAPNLSLTDLMRYADPEQNSAIALFKAPAAQLITPADSLPYLQIKNRSETPLKIYLWQRFPALDLFSQCQLCFTTVGANTAQLGALAIPMIVLLPTQQLDSLSIADGLPGLIAQIPGMGQFARKIINPLAVRALQKSGKRFAWPNIWAKDEVVPELFGEITPDEVSAIAQTYLAHPEKLAAIRQNLRTLRGPAGAADKMADLILETVDYSKR